MTNKKQEQNEQNDPQLETKYAQATARIAQLEMENKGQKNLILQIENLLGGYEVQINEIVDHIEDGAPILGGIKFEALRESVKSNFIALQSITKEWKKE